MRLADHAQQTSRRVVGHEQTDAIGCTRTAEHLFMDGQAITTFALQRVPALVHSTREAAGVAAADVQWFVFHQANAFMNERLREA